jgi:hypothetical protein
MIWARTIIDLWRWKGAKKVTSLVGIVLVVWVGQQQGTITRLKQQCRNLFWSKFSQNTNCLTSRLNWILVWIFQKFWNSSNGLKFWIPESWSSVMLAPSKNTILLASLHIYFQCFPNHSLCRLSYGGVWIPWLFCRSHPFSPNSLKKYPNRWASSELFVTSNSL